MSTRVEHQKVAVLDRHGRTELLLRPSDWDAMAAWLGDPDCGSRVWHNVVQTPQWKERVAREQREDGDVPAEAPEEPPAVRSCACWR